MTFRMNAGPLSIIVAVDTTGGFGKEGKIPWHFPEDFKHFKEVTKDAICIMGRRTYTDMLEMIVDRRIKKGEKKEDIVIDSILPNRKCLVLSRSITDAEGAEVFSSLREATQSLDANEKREVFILGGEKLFIEALPYVNRIYMTIIKDKEYSCDRFFPVDLVHTQFKIINGEETDNLQFVNYVRR